MLELKLFEGDDDAWDLFLSNVKDGTVFHRSAWLNILQKTDGIALRKLGFYLDGNLIGLFPLFIKKVSILSAASSPFYVEDTPYMGVVSDVLDINDAIEAIAAYMRKNSISFLRFVQSKQCDGLKSRTNLEIIDKHTHILKLDKSLDELWKNFEGRCRTAVRKAQKSGIEVKLVTEIGRMADYYTMLTDVYNRQEQVYPHSLEFFVEIFKKFDGKELYMLVAEYDEKVIAGGIFLMDADTVYYLNGASIKEFNNLGVNNLIQWTSISHAHALGRKQYDFVGSDQDRFGTFKKSFGGVLECNQCMELSNSNAATLLRKWYPKCKTLAMKYFKKRV